MMFRAVDIFYWWIYRVGVSLMWAIRPWNKKVREGFDLRKKNSQNIYPWLALPANTHPIWFHCSSGEFEYALPVIRELKRIHPEQKILVTYYTPSYVNKIRKEPLVDMHCPLPWDTKEIMRDFVEHHQPRALLLARTGVWPEMTRQCFLRNIPVSIFSMTFNKDLSLPHRYMYQWLHRFIVNFYVVTEADKLALQNVSTNFNIVVLGDTRYDQCLYRLKQESVKKIDAHVFTKKVLVGASLWPEDESAILPVILSKPDLFHWILVPHEIHQDQLKELQAKFMQKNIPVFLFSEISLWDGTGVLIVDQLGVLASLYKVTDVALIGGSFRKRVHSVMESLACGNLTFVGPFHNNNREALEFSKNPYPALSMNPVQIIEKKEMTEIALEKTFTWTAEDRQLLTTLFQQKSGVSHRLAGIILADEGR
jgi:3-deoxy-D-manno-octulosonic-acid transferase